MFKAPPKGADQAIGDPYSRSPLPARLIGGTTHAPLLQNAPVTQLESPVHEVPQVADAQRNPLQSVVMAGTQAPLPLHWLEATTAELVALHAGVELQTNPLCSKPAADSFMKLPDTPETTSLPVAMDSS